MANDRRTTLEAQRIEALYSRDGLTYKSLCDALGYTRLALEDADLYDSVSGVQVEEVRLEKRKASTLEDLDDSKLRAISLVLEKFVPRAPKNNLQGDREISSRLGRLSRYGYPVPDFSDLKGPQMFNLYLEIKAKVLQEKSKRKIN